MAVVPDGAQPLGTLAQGTPLRLTVALEPRDPQALAAYAAGGSTPGSPSYRRFLSVRQFAHRFAPTGATVAAVRVSLERHGLHPGPLAANGLAIPVSTTAAQAQAAFSTTLRRYALGGGRVAVAPTVAPELDASIAGAVQSVVGLSTVGAPRPVDLVRQAPVPAAAAHVVTGGPQPCSQASAIHAYTADQIASAYRFSSLYRAGDLGAGQTIALYELEPFDLADIQTYQSCYGTSTSITNVPVDGGAGSGAGQGEAVLDVEDLIGLAPHARILVYSGPNSDSGAPGAGPYDTYQAIISQDQAKVISSSWGTCETQEGATDAAAENTLFQEAAVQGQAILAASGDTGAEGCTGLVGQPVAPATAGDPASQPFITGVGGSTLSALGPPPQESVWNSFTLFGLTSGGASGGGVSDIWKMPLYQSLAPSALHVINSASTGAGCGAPSGYCREVPDVAADADPAPGYAIYFSGQWTPVGGTSAAAPTWAALLSLANASSTCAGTPVGFANPPLYRIAGSVYGGVFNDITTGNNAVPGEGGYSAGAGYDMTTGLGSPNGGTIATALCDRVIVTSPGSQRSVQGARVRLAAAARSTARLPVTFTASGLPAGLALGPASGIVSGSPSAVGRSAVSITAHDAFGAFATAGLRFTVRAPTVTLRRPADRRSVVGRSARLRLLATLNNGRAPTFSAFGLPRGLRINLRTGVISGVPSATGRYHVKVAASYARISRSARFIWLVTAGRPR